MSHHDPIPTLVPQVRITAAGRQYLRLTGREQQHLAGERGAVVPTPGAPHDYLCGECSDAGPVARAAYAVVFTGPACARKEHCCPQHLTTLIDYAAAVSTRFEPIAVEPLKAVAA